MEKHYDKKITLKNSSPKPADYFVAKGIELCPRGYKFIDHAPAILGAGWKTNWYLLYKKTGA